MLFLNLEWDSKFFQKKIGKIIFELGDDELALRREIDLHQDLDLLYIFTPENRMLSLPGLDQRCSLVDQKIDFAFLLKDDKGIRTGSDFGYSIEFYNGQYPIDDLIQLAFQSGEFSRFNLDPNFSESDFHKLYKKWMEGSVDHTLADQVLVAVEGNKVLGMITVQYSGSQARIGLFSVFKEFRGNKIGFHLIQRVKEEAKSRGKDELFVATQLQNELSCKFYVNNGFSKQNISNIYHYWY